MAERDGRARPIDFTSPRSELWQFCAVWHDRIGRTVATVRAVVSRVSHTTFDCGDAFALSEWWKQVLGYTDLPGDPNEAGDEECMIVDPSTGHRVLFIQVPDDKSVKNRVHLDLVPTDRRRDDEIDRVVALGATTLADRRNADGTGWVTLGDPEGNEFCIVRSDMERREHTA